MSGREKRRVRLAELERLKAQIAEIEWLLGESGYDETEWSAKVVTHREEGELVLGLRLSPRHNRSVLVLSTPRPGRSDIGEKHFWIDGNRHYDRFATAQLSSRLSRDEGEE